MEFDVAVIGAGPAGLQAALHAARKKVKVCVLGKVQNSALLKAEIENYFGTEPKSGREMLEITAKAAAGFGAVLLEEDLLNIEMDGEVFKLKTESLKEIKAKAVVLATGHLRKKLNVEEESTTVSRVSYCATATATSSRRPWPFTRETASMAASAALLLREYASKVYWVAKEFKASPELMDKVKGTDIEMVEPGQTKIHEDQVVRGDATGQRTRPGPRWRLHRAGSEGVADLAMGSKHLPGRERVHRVDRHCATDTPGYSPAGT